MKLRLLFSAILTVVLFRASAATFTVTSTSASGPGSLAQAITDANGSPGADTISFNLAGNGVHTINFSSLPTVTEALTIDGTTQPGYAGSPLVALVVNSGGGTPAALNLTAGACVVRGLAINQQSGFGDAIQISGPGGNVIAGCFIGTTAQGTALSAQPGNQNGIRIKDSPNNVIGGVKPADRNLISGNNFGVIISGASALANAVKGNYIGVDVTGTSAVPNAIGVYVSASASGTLVGGTSPGARNVISGNRQDGLTVSDANNSIIQGNFIGTDATGTHALGNATTNNQASGITISAISKVATNNLIGGTVPGTGNLISGNNYSGITLLGVSASGNRIQGNFIGLDRTGQQPLGNREDGVLLLGASANQIGGTPAGAGNYISANGDNGIELAGTFGDTGASSSNNVIVGNFIGVPAPAAIPLAAALAPALGARIAPHAATRPIESSPTIYLNGALVDCNPIRITRGDNTWIGTSNPFQGNNTLASWSTAPGVNILGGRGNTVGGGIFLGDYGDMPFIYNADKLVPYPVVNVKLVLPMMGQLDFSADLNTAPSDSYDVICYAPIEITDYNLGAYFGYRRGYKVIGSNFAFTNPSGYSLLQGTWPLNTTKLSITLANGTGTTSTSSKPSLVLPYSAGDTTFALSLLPPAADGPSTLTSPFNSFLQGKSKLDGTWLNHGYGVGHTLSIDDAAAQYYRGALGVTMGNVSFKLKDPANLERIDYTIRYAGGAPAGRTDTNGSCTLSNAPLGAVKLEVGKEVQTTNATSGQVSSFELMVDLDITNLIAQTEILLNAAEEELTATPCDCSAWCGIIGGTINGVQTVVASGGKLGFCLDEPEVTITGPGGVNVAFPAAPIPRRKREKFAPAANGTWTVTVSVCGKSKTCSITLP